MNPVIKYLEKNKIISKEGDVRWYSIAGSRQWVPSVTSILSAADKGEFFHKWLANQGSWDNACKVRDKAAKRGTIVHEISEDLLNGEEIILDAGPEIVKRIMCLEEWYNNYQPEIIAQEIMLAFPGVRFAGRFDILARIDGKTVLIDIKTGEIIEFVDEEIEKLQKKVDLLVINFFFIILSSISSLLFTSLSNLFAM